MEVPLTRHKPKNESRAHSARGRLAAMVFHAEDEGIEVVILIAAFGFYQFLRLECETKYNDEMLKSTKRWTSFNLV
jgi:hypothetical protein